MSESVVLCEGYHDRAFWAGWLTHLGCSDEGFKPGTNGYPADDPWGRKVTGGQFGYRSTSGAFIRVVQCKGKTNLLPEATNRLALRTAKPLLRLVINIDPDVPIAGSAVTGLRLQDVLNFVRTQIDPAAAQTPDGEIVIDGGASRISLIRWEAGDAAAPGLPDQETLERLVCAAMAAVYPARATAVQDWLNARPLPPPVNPKDHAWSYMAGWHSESSCEFFYQNLWNEAGIVRELESRLRASGAWRVAELLAM